MVRTHRPFLEELTDAELLEAFRSGETHAYAVLFTRHEPAAIKVAHRRTYDHHLAVDAAHEAFTNILAAIESGSGPVGSFTGYLYSCVIREAIRQQKFRRHEVTVSEYPEHLPGTEVPDMADQLSDPGLRAAFRALPERWQRVLWYMDVLEQTPIQTAPLFGLTPNAMAVLHRRAKNGLRQAYLQQAAS